MRGSVPDAPMLRVACLQMALAPTVPAALAKAGALARQAADQGARLALLPEYWYMPTGEARRPNGAEARFAPLREALQGLSRDLGIALAGNVPEHADGQMWNTLFAFDGGVQVGAQRKVHPMPTEEGWGVAAASSLSAWPWSPARLGGLVCADVLHPEAARILALQGAEVVLNPVMSWRKPNDGTREARKAMFIARAYDNACFVLKAGSVGSTVPGSQLVGRSLVAAPWGLVAECKDEGAEEVLLADLDLARLREERKRSLSLGRRQPQAYGALTQPGPPPAPTAGKGDFDV
jgi:omega-amidase